MLFIVLTFLFLQVRVGEKEKSYYSKSSPDHFIPIYFWKAVKAPLGERSVLNYLKGLDLSKLKKNLEK